MQFSSSYSLLPSPPKEEKMNSLTSAVQSSKYKRLKAHRKTSEIKVTQTPHEGNQISSRYKIYGALQSCKDLVNVFLSPLHSLRRSPQTTHIFIPCIPVQFPNSKLKLHFLRFIMNESFNFVGKKNLFAEDEHRICLWTPWGL